MTIIAIDPSYNKDVGIAWIKNGKVKFDSVKIDKEDKKPKTRKLNRIAYKIFMFMIDKIIIRGAGASEYIFAIESQFMGYNPEMTMTLVELRGLVEGMIYMFFNMKDVNIVSVNPRAWQSFIGCNRMKSEEIKKRSIKYASELTKKDVSEDEADAICILKYIEQKENNWN
jgi:Holliday junction resolvasome RuvABC endonuclease subunit